MIEDNGMNSELLFINDWSLWAKLSLSKNDVSASIENAHAQRVWNNAAHMWDLTQATSVEFIVIFFVATSVLFHDTSFCDIRTWMQFGKFDPVFFRIRVSSKYDQTMWRTSSINNKKIVMMMRCTAQSAL